LAAIIFMSDTPKQPSNEKPHWTSKVASGFKALYYLLKIVLELTVPDIFEDLF
jgi:hypothetical protein